MRLIKKVTNFILILQALNSTNLIVICEHFKELQKMNSLPPVPLSLINLFGFYVKMKTNVSRIEQVTPETGQMTDFLKGFLHVMDFDRFSHDFNFV